MKKTNLIIINPTQFGYQTEQYYYCKYLKNFYSIIYLCWDQNLPKIKMPGVKIKYVNKNGNFILRGIRYLKCAFREISDSENIILVKYFKVISSFLKLCKPCQCFVLDIRSGSVAERALTRVMSDARLKIETKLFNNITVISKGLAEKLNIAHKAHILPLGADIISDKNKEFDELNLLYVGTLDNRNIEVTIEGLKKFYDEFNTKIHISYTIVGSGPNNEEKMLKDLVSQYKMTDIVTIAGRVQHNRLKEYFDKTNIGISYIPLTDYFDVQPPTKTFEYLLSGMPVVATCTTENKRVINSENGVLVGDKSEDFYMGLKIFYEKRNFFDSKNIRDLSMDYSWKNIVMNNLKVYLEDISH